MNVTEIGTIAQITSSVILLLTAFILWLQIQATKRAAYASAFKEVYDMLQDETRRNERGFVLGNLAKRDYDTWTDDDKKQAEKVCHNYDAVGIICRHKLLPTKLIADSWGDSLRRCWRTLKPIVFEYRKKRDSNEFWDDFEWLAQQAEKFKK